MIAVAFVLAVLLLGFGIWMYRWQYAEADRILSEWATEHELRVVEKTRANPYGTGPGNRSASDKRIVYRIRTVDAGNRSRAATATIGAKLTGVLEKQIEVQWDSSS